jgi:hypothetical protein
MGSTGVTSSRWLRHAYQAVDQQFARCVMLHVQSNPCRSAPARAC